MEHSEGENLRDDCLFCGIADGRIPAEIVLSNELVVAFRDIAPTAPTHVLVIPREHFPNVEAISIHAPNLLAEMVRLAGSVAELDGLEGHRIVFNTGAIAGQSIFHAHLHLLGGRPLQWPAG
ncbi:HIT-like protein [mine drainage metagenome]|uniref:HIT-like protein n=1 Tax=mine drainage metagenome TaxID=410659 RepID=A0A1J5QDY0_9ZZZZ